MMNLRFFGENHKNLLTFTLPDKEAYLRNRFHIDVDI